MPKQPAGKTKSQRMQALREVLERGGRLDKAMIDERVAGNLGVNVEALRKPLYRDLKEMVDAGDVRPYYFSADGVPIEEFDPEIHHNSKGEWALVGSEYTVRGQKLLEETGGEFYPFSRLDDEFKIDSGTPPIDIKTVHIFFGIQSTFFCLKISSDDLPASIVLGRTRGPADSKPPIEQLEKKFGKRAALLLLPVPSVSGMKPAVRDGHVLLEFKERHSVVVTDLGSRNGTKAHKVSNRDAEVIRKSGDLLGKETVNADWIATAATLSNWTQCNPGSPTSTTLPALVRLSQDFQILIV